MSLLLAGDLGGTKTLLALYESTGNQLNCLTQKRFGSAEWPHLLPMLQTFLGEQLKTGLRVDAACIAVAGPVQHGKAAITNLAWDLDQQELATSSGLAQLELVNDFAVLVYGLPHLNSEQQVTIQVGSADPNGPIAIIGAGTGLGMARGFQHHGELLSLASEGGHREFAPRNTDEMLLEGWLRKHLGVDRLSVERVVSGTGLGLIYLWLEHCGAEEEHFPLSEAAKAWRDLPPGSPNRPDLPALVAKQAANGGPIASRAQEIWLGAYGSAAGDLAVHEMASGGLWVGGGTANKQLDGLKSQAFLSAMAKKGRFSDFVGNLPVKALVDSDAGLFSAACRARVLAECA
ncbi:MAG: glucokinase [Synechococcus lacustris str. Tous]|nr:MAG: glucokinase [Synechococcus lacustris str. Tous]